MKHPVDVHVGKRIHHRRWMIGMTQQQLADQVGIKFQQIQKYETGMNRVSASRLWDIAETLGVNIGFFFEGIDEAREATFIANNDDRHAPGVAGDVVAQHRQLRQGPDIVPVLAEDMRNLPLGDRRIGVPARRERLAAVERRHRAFHRLFRAPAYRLSRKNCCGPVSGSSMPEAAAGTSCHDPGASDALRDVAKQVQRNKEAWTVPTEQMPVFGTMAARFNDDGVTALYQALKTRLAELGMQTTEGRLPKVGVRFSTHQNPVVPSARTRYLAEISDTVRGYKKRAIDQSRLAREIQQLRAAARMLEVGKAGRAKAAEAAIDLAVSREQTQDPTARKLLAQWPDMQKAYAGDEYVVKIRDKEIRTALTTKSLSGTTIRKVALPQYEDHGEVLKWLMLDNVPGSYPYTAGTFAFKREGEDPTRMFAGEGDPFRTNRRFKLLSAGTPATASVAGSPYLIVPSDATGGTFTPGDYTISYVNGSMVVTPAPLVVTADNQTKPYGTAFAFAGTEFTSSGLVNAETIGSATRLITAAISDTKASGIQRGTLRGRPVWPSDTLDIIDKIMPPMAPTVNR